MMAQLENNTAGFEQWKLHHAMKWHQKRADSSQFLKKYISICLTFLFCILLLLLFFLLLHLSQQPIDLLLHLSFELFSQVVLGGSTGGGSAACRRWSSSCRFTLLLLLMLMWWSSWLLRCCLPFLLLSLNIIFLWILLFLKLVWSLKTRDCNMAQKSPVGNLAYYFYTYWVIEPLYTL